MSVLKNTIPEEKASKPLYLQLLRKFSRAMRDDSEQKFVHVYLPERELWWLLVL